MRGAFSLFCMLAFASQLPSPFDQSHSGWTEILQKYVSNKTLNYDHLHKEGQEKLQSYLKTLESVQPEIFQQWTKPEKIAFWINAYNAYATYLLLWQYQDPQKKMLLKSDFKRKFIPIFLFSPPKNPVSLDDIEDHLKNFGEVRIHFALVCGAESCPVLHPEAFVAPRLKDQLEMAAKEFINDTSRNRYNPGTKILWLSKIFEWNQKDFEKIGGTLQGYVSKYLPGKVTDEMGGRSVQIKFVEYKFCVSGRCPLPTIP